MTHLLFPSLLSAALLELAMVAVASSGPLTFYVSIIVFMSCCAIEPTAVSSSNMSFTIIKNLEPLPSYPVLCKLAEQHHVCITGDEHAGSFSCRGVEGGYAFGDNGLRGKFISRGVTGEFSFESGNATVTVIEKPFWLPESLVKQMITEGLDTLGKELAQSRSA